MLVVVDEKKELRFSSLPGFWITNPDNSWYNNLVVDAPLGYWLATPNNPDNRNSGWSNSNGEYWTEKITGELGGAVMNPSKQ